MTANDSRLQQMLDADRPTLVMFYSKDDAHSMQEIPVVDEAVQRLSTEANILKLDAQSNPGLIKKYHVHAYPTFILFSDGQEAWRATGRMPFAEIKDMVQRFA